jgi:hypothetical protein
MDKTKTSVIALIFTGVGLTAGYLISEYRRFKASDEYYDSYDDEGETKHHASFIAFIKKDEEEKKAIRKARKNNVDPAEAESPQE